MPSLALVDRLRALSPPDRRRILSRCSTQELAALTWCWREFWARPDERPAGAREGRGQLAPAGEWTWWANIGGRGSGKTKTCAEWVMEEALRLGRGCRIHLVAQSIDDGRDTMIEGPSGLMACAPPWAGLTYAPSVVGGTVEWRNGARARLFGADRPTKGRGPQCNRMWLDDPAAFGPHGLQVLEQLLFGFRSRGPDGSGPRGVISSTPLESDLMRWILAGEDGKRASTVVYSRSESDDNRHNLAENFFTETLAEFAGTELEQQERFGRSPWSTSKKIFAGISFSGAPVRVDTMPDRFLTVAVWIDPSTSTSTRSCEVGLVVVGLTSDGHLYLLQDLSGVYGAQEWPEIALTAVERWTPHAASVHLGVETNQSGNQPEGLLRSAEKIRRLQRGLPGVSVIEIREINTSRSKAVRATPLPRLYAAGQLHHLAGAGLEMLERQLRELDDRPALGRDRADAFVYAVLDLAGILDHARGGAMVGGVSVGPAAFGGRPGGAVNVGSSSPTVVPHIAGSFSFGGGGRWL